ncbi:MAG: sialate O-acetylesterase [Planctomycetia bacterium]|nr:sialate O-acetylesterase [Planctomycetia bacterium]
MKANLLALVALSLTFLPTVNVQAATPHGIFTDHMVLQRELPIPVWGTGQPGEKVSVRMAGHSAETTVDDQGHWHVELDALPAGGPHRLVIEGHFRAAVRDVLVGEVWLASGQSNMQWTINRSSEAEKVVAASSHPNIRLFTVPRRSTEEPEWNVNGAWEVCGPESTPEFSAVAYHFGVALHEKLGIPIGMVSTNYGGTPAEAWMSKESLAANEMVKYYVDQPRDLSNAQRPYGLYNAMVHPLAPMAVRGAIWYQGESNAGRAYEYKTLFPAMIADWRRAFRQPEMPFLFVQLAPFMDKTSEPGDSEWAELRDSQRLTAQNDKRTAMAVITDVGDEKDIHPVWKQPVGERLALAARAIAYGEEVEFQGAEPDTQHVGNALIKIKFSHVAGGLQAKDGPLTGFAIAGEDGKFVNATAEIVGQDEVDVRSDAVPEPKYVRYGWANFPQGNLWNGAGLPTSPFKTDEFRWTTQPK